MIDFSLSLRSVKLSSFFYKFDELIINTDDDTFSEFPLVDCRLTGYKADLEILHIFRYILFLELFSGREYCKYVNKYIG